MTLIGESRLTPAAILLAFIVVACGSERQKSPAAADTIRFILNHAVISGGTYSLRDQYSSRTSGDGDCQIAIDIEHYKLDGTETLSFNWRDLNPSSLEEHDDQFTLRVVNAEPRIKRVWAEQGYSAREQYLVFYVTNSQDSPKVREAIAHMFERCPGEEDLFSGK